MLTRDFDYPLDAAAIAQQPAPRGASRLLVLDREGEARHRRIADLPALLRSGDLLVVNDTRVLPARLYGRAVRAVRNGGVRGGGSASAAPTAAPPISGFAGAAAAPEAPREIELLLVERVGEREWEALARPGRRAKPGVVIEIARPGGTRAGSGPGGAAADGSSAVRDPGADSGSGAGGGPGAGSGVFAEVTALTGDGRRRVRFSEPIEPHLDRLGHVPLPPYIHRPDEPADRERYQTVFARRPGAIAAPTAGLHFSDELLAGLAGAGVELATVTLHVGIGTFKPVTAPLVSDHRMERERYEISEAAAAALARARAAGRRVVAVGTTVVRTLEGAAAGAAGEVPAGAGETELFITPGFRFQVVDALLTNFHLPRSTLLMLVSAFAGRERVLAAYHEALGRGYRFFSYGDAMLAERRPDP
ncbi:MAG TPA: tRNA preQ1(34) S-adenosylmethionine ribosyltransferase-isomerase QueA [Thermoanaerobaculia bacterium]|nr:tRNA preQ1(34) S-adenosylmethionine ribosyltransferase-isomerase QueA [Thermoanaerobaculia bacterium]